MYCRFRCSVFFYAFHVLQSQKLNGMLLFAAVRSDRYLDFTELTLPHAISYAQLIEVKTTINKYEMFVPVK